MGLIPTIPGEAEYLGYGKLQERIEDNRTQTVPIDRRSPALDIIHRPSFHVFPIPCPNENGGGGGIIRSL
ncbi:MAG: hypothetical protein SWY16_24140 [Cyanobacteriota bacterium]|nr:hypothetical protein [Cyanobacteriota bacterium]